MSRAIRRSTAVAALLTAAPLLAAAPLAAQDSTVSPAPAQQQQQQQQQSPAVVAAPKQTISINPIFAMFGVYSGQIERALTASTTLSIGASHWDMGGDGEVDGAEVADGRVSYVTGDVHLRYYPSGTALSGVSFGLSGGWTRLGGDFSTREDEAHPHAGGPTFGVEIAHSWLLGSRRNVVLTTGFGAKRLFVREADNASLAYPTARLGFGFAF
jgi:hypothetical protein